MKLRLCMVFGLVLICFSTYCRAEGLESPTLEQIAEQADERLIFNWSDVTGASSYAITIAGKVSYYDPDKLTHPEVPVTFQIQTIARNDGKTANDSAIELPKEQFIGLVLESMRIHGIESEKVPLLLLESAATVTAINRAAKPDSQFSLPSNLVVVPPLMHKSNKN